MFVESVFKRVFCKSYMQFELLSSLSLAETFTLEGAFSLDFAVTFQGSIFFFTGCWNLVVVSIHNA